MNHILDVQNQAKNAYRATDGMLPLVDISNFSECSKRTFMRTWMKCKHPFLRTVNEIGFYV